MTEEGILKEIPWSTKNILAERFYQKLVAESGWFEGVIQHMATVGSFYETLIRSTLKEYLPSNHKIGTGFVFDSQTEKHGRQLDILIYDDTNIGVLYKSDEFVVVYPGSVVAVSEIKKTLTNRNIKKVIENSVLNNLGSAMDGTYGLQRMHIFGFNCNTSIESVFNGVCNSIKAVFKKYASPENIDIISAISLPQIYFLNLDYYIESTIKPNSAITYDIEVILHKVDRFQSTGHYLDAMLIEDQSKTTPYERRYLSQKVRRIPEERKELKLYLPLFSKYPIIDIFESFKMSRQYFEQINKRNSDNALSVYIPISNTLKQYTNIDKLLDNDNVFIEYRSEKGETEKYLIRACDIL
ncbi:DUF6602 domain-containing protein [Lewinella sp. IMCC34191]|uniref:DUF6602 domain-containing protein n=1 Tax=Lewinella sp. IMCC34191 TaxID=2259172 RepID=UPI001300226B|nr:DUF6602 domain-containing protein [Lewinella sp. IMCC34191]